MRTVLLLAMITVSEATIGVFVKLVDGRIPIATLNFCAMAFAAAFLLVAVPRATGRPLEFPVDNLRDTLIIGVLIATQISVFNFAMTLAPIANVVIFWSVAPFFSFLFAWAFLGERPRPSSAPRVAPGGRRPPDRRRAAPGSTSTTGPAGHRGGSP